MIVRKKIFIFTLAIASSFIASDYTPLLAFNPSYQGTNSIPWIDSREKKCTKPEKLGEIGLNSCTPCPATNYSSVPVNTNSSLPAKTIERLESLGIQEKATKNKAFYEAAANEKGVPWQILAALHYREATMGYKRSILNGQPITGKPYRNVDNFIIAATPEEDAIKALDVFMGNAKSIYGVSIGSTNSLDEIATAFLAYNRGAMYKSWGKSWSESPYVMNGYDEAHMDMVWNEADQGVKGKKKFNNLAGKTDGNKVGALALFIYLGGSTASGGTGPGGGLASGGECDQGPTGPVAIIGEKAFPLAGGKSSVNNPGMFRNNNADLGGHPYTAYDILADPGVPVVAFLSGRVTRIGQDKCPGRLVSVYNAEQDLTVSYLHLNLNTEVAVGQSITVGQRVGQVGPNSAGCGIPHLHIDVAKGNKRPGCRRENCPRANAAKFVNVGRDLYQLFQALP